MLQEKNKRKIGSKVEQAVREYLSGHGFEILEMNYRCKQGEIDIIAKEDLYYVFIEVKYRTSTRYGFPQEAVGLSKQRRICSAARYYLYSNHIGESVPVRFDVAAVLEDKITYIRDAFPFRI